MHVFQNNASFLDFLHWEFQVAISWPMALNGGWGGDGGGVSTCVPACPPLNMTALEGGNCATLMSLVLTKVVLACCDRHFGKLH